MTYCKLENDILTCIFNPAKNFCAVHPDERLLLRGGGGCSFSKDKTLETGKPFKVCGEIKEICNGGRKNRV
jgi:hypothetical protein